MNHDLDLPAEFPLAAFAPLSVPYLRHCFSGIRGRTRKPPTLSEWKDFQQKVQDAGNMVYRIMTPAVLNGRLSTEWLRYALAILRLQRLAPQPHVHTVRNQIAAHLNALELATREGQPLREVVNITPIPTSSFHRWHQNGVLSSEDSTHLPIHQTAAMLIVAAIDGRESGWLPSHMHWEDARIAVFREDGPHLPRVQSSIPPGQEGPPEEDEHGPVFPWTLFSSGWQGFAWQKPRVQIKDIAVMWWASCRTDEEGEVWWDVPIEGVQLWDPRAAAQHVPRLDEATHIRHDIADLALIHLAEERLFS